MTGMCKSETGGCNHVSEQEPSAHALAEYAARLV